MKILRRSLGLFSLLFCLASVDAALAMPFAPPENLYPANIHQIAGPLVPPSPLICDGSRRVCVRWHNIPGGMACSRWELRFHGCRARR